MYPETVARLILENPIGLEDYRTFVPYDPLEQVERNELKATAESYRNHQKTYYPEWKPEYEQYSEAQAADLKLPNFARIAFVNALTYQMIYEQPVVYEFENIKTPTLLIIGQLDRTVVGKAKVPKDIVNNFGQYPKLGKELRAKIKNSKLVELEGVGHIPHIQTPEKFEQALAEFLR
jgi:pimeloyl-ACP methyl ester carboxylesterase